MARTSTASFLLFLMATVSCLTITTAEENTAAQNGENRQSKQLFFVPKLYPAPQSTFYYPESSSYGNPFMRPTEEVLLPQQTRVPNWLSSYPSLSLATDDASHAAWRVHDGIADLEILKWWKHRFNRQAVITIRPAVAECLLADIGTNGLSNCKRASDAHQGTIEVKLQTANQVAVIGITASSPVNTRIRLICTDLNAVAVFTHTGQIAAVSDTPRTEIGSMQLVVSSTAANGLLRCSWRSYHHYTAAYP